MVNYKGNRVITFIRYCKSCDELFKPKSKYNYFCKKCLKKAAAKRKLRFKYYLKKKGVKK